MVADGELFSRRTAQVRAHVTACRDCRARMAEFEQTIVDFAQLYRQGLDPQVPPIAGSRALLRAQLTELAVNPKSGPWQWFRQFAFSFRSAAYVGMASLAVVLAGMGLLQYFTVHETNSDAISFVSGAVPDRSLTPGATRRATVSDICSNAHEEVVRAVPASLRQEVLQKYGIGEVSASDYEIDYLIAPGLGGAEDVQNLWPQSYRSSVWNAHVKDALEERLHQMVCAGKLDLPTAQHDISTDWIAAYKKYFHTDRPVTGNLDLISDEQSGLRWGFERRYPATRPEPYDRRRAAG